METITTRFLAFYEHLVSNKNVKGKSDFAAQVDISPSLMTEISKERTAVGMELLQKTVKKFPFLNTNWIITGDGNMIMTLTTQEDAPGKLIPFYDVEAAAGKTVVDLMPVTTPSGMIDVGDLLRDSECAIRVYGNSMTPNYPSGCVVGLREVKDGIIEYGNVYVIETEDNRYLKRLFIDREGRGYACYSDNTMVFADGPRKGETAYETFVIQFDKIIRIYRVTGVIKRNENSAIVGKKVA